MAYREAQERHEEILRIEQNIAELAQLMNDVCLHRHRRIRMTLILFNGTDERPCCTSR